MPAMLAGPVANRQAARRLGPAGWPRQGQAAPEFLFGTMYRLRKWKAGRFEEVAVAHGFMDADRNPAEAIE